MIRRSKAIGNAPAAQTRSLRPCRTHSDARTLRFGSIQHISDDHQTHLTGRVVVVHCSRSSCWYWRRLSRRRSMRGRISGKLDIQLIRESGLSRHLRASWWSPTPGTEPRALVAPASRALPRWSREPRRLGGAGPGGRRQARAIALTMALSGRADWRDERLATTPALGTAWGLSYRQIRSRLPASCGLRRVGPPVAKLSDEACQAFGLDPHLERRRRARCSSGSESSVTAALDCLFPRSRKRRHFGDDLGWHLNFGFFFLIWRPVNFRLLLRSGSDS